MTIVASCGGICRCSGAIRDCSRSDLLASLRFCAVPLWSSRKQVFWGRVGHAASPLRLSTASRRLFMEFRLAGGAIHG